MTPLRTVDLSTFARFLGLSMISQEISVSPLKLQKLLYYQQAWHMAFFGRENQLFLEAPQAWVNGPVYPTIYHQYKGMVPGMCDHLKAEHFGVDPDHVSEELARLYESLGLEDDEYRLFQSVMSLYGAKTQNQLIFLTHAELPWSEAREGLLPFEHSERSISLDTMCNYYRERRERRRTAR